jgi:hypothetical protein
MDEGKTNAWPGGPDEWFTAASVNWSWDPMLGYVGGFSRAGRILVDHLAAGDRGEQDFLVYPVVYCYRHAVEIALKGIITEARDLLDEPGGLPSGHRLSDLWNTCKPLMQRVLKDSDAEYEILDRVVGRLDYLDPTGEAFRYPFGIKDKGASPTLPPEVRHIPLGHLAAEVDEALVLLDGADTGLGVYLDRKAENAECAAEMRAEYAAEMRSEYYG